MKMILQGPQSGYAGKVTIGKLYEHFDGCFHDDEGAIRSTGPYAWKKPKASKVSKVSKVPATQKPYRKPIIELSKCFGTQEDGSHYTEMQLQPLEATYLRYGIEGLKAAIHTKVDKYISRKKDDEVIQLKKAHHCLAILIEITELEHAYS